MYARYYQVGQSQLVVAARSYISGDVDIGYGTRVNLPPVRTEEAAQMSGETSSQNTSASPAAFLKHFWDKPTMLRRAQRRAISTDGGSLTRIT